MGFGKLLVRVVVGGLFVGHGLQKLRGDFGGPGIDGTTAMMEKLEMRPARRNAHAVALTETIGGAAIAAGVATPFAAAGLIATMVTAIRKVHLQNGVWNSQGGFEYNAVLIATVAALTAEGPGRVSGDALVGRRRWGALWGLFALGAGAAGSFVVTELAKRESAGADENESASDDTTDPTTDPTTHRTTEESAP